MVGTQRFDQRLREHFEAEKGAFSLVTATEAGDGQVTVSSDEKMLVIDHFGADDLAKYQGNDAVIESAGLDARREFRLWPTGAIVRPKLKYPKPGNSELRLYFNNDEFKVRENHFWGVFIKEGEIWIFNSPQPFLEQIKSGKFLSNTRGQALEDEPDDYQAVINNKEPSQSTSTQKAWNRDTKIAAKALQVAEHKCELYPNLPVFTSRSTGNPFVEAHHLIPMKLQGDFTVSLDVVKNICALSPFAHRKIHHASFDDIVGDVRELVKKRLDLLEYANVSEDELLGYYRV